MSLLRHRQVLFCVDLSGFILCVGEGGGGREWGGVGGLMMRMMGIVSGVLCIVIEWVGFGFRVFGFGFRIKGSSE